MKYENLTKNTRTLALDHSALAAFSSLATNAALRCEQRYHKTSPYHRKHKTQRWNEKCQALGITLKNYQLRFTPSHQAPNLTINH
ncbi:hypothetical protein EBM76_22440 [Vibrio parahaemolyticus]|nr:hypothetical protein [Vibrio parahaemolyticus]